MASTTGDTAVAGAALLDTLDVAGDVDVNSGKFTVASTTGNTVVARDAERRGDYGEHPELGGGRCRARWAWRAT